jgi:hypothetical protein
MDKCSECPECGDDKYEHPGMLGEGYRMCASCTQEWYTTINYKKYRSPSYYYEVFTQAGISLPTTDRKGDANSFDKRSIKRRIRKLVKRGWAVTAFITAKGKKREMIFSSWPPNAMELKGLRL